MTTKERKAVKTMSKKVYYATHDHDGYKINKYAEIVRFDSYEDMKSYLMGQFSGEDLKNVEIELGEFGEYWIESYKPIHVGNQHIYAPFTYRQLYINRHNNATWVTPIHVDVYVAGLSE
jgi:hypothetical protein